MPRAIKPVKAEKPKPKAKPKAPEATTYDITEEQAEHLLGRLSNMGFKKLTTKQVQAMAAKPDTGNLPETLVHHSCRNGEV